MSDSGFATLVAQRRVIVCCGPGGVGKTTVSAAIGIAAATIGRRVCVITIDPARRLADALGAGALDNTPRAIAGEWQGTLDAMALDAKATFDDLIRRNAADKTQAERILDNGIYQSLVSSLSGTQEYMATEKLHQVLDGGRYDLVVVDTPPSRNALDFLDAPARLSNFLDNKIMRMLFAPARSGLRAAGLASELVLRNLGRVAGRAIVDDTIAFFRAFSGMEEGFRLRANAVSHTLSSDDTAFVLITSARAESVREIEFFASEIASRNLAVAVMIVNRVLPDFGDELLPAPPGSADSPWSELVQNLVDLRSMATSERTEIDRATLVARDAPLVRLPLAPEDIHDLDGLDLLARRLLAGTVR